MSWAASPAPVSGSAGAGDGPRRPGPPAAGLARRARSASGLASVIGAAVIWLALLGPVITLLTHLSWHEIVTALAGPRAPSTRSSSRWNRAR